MDELGKITPDFQPIPPEPRRIPWGGGEFATTRLTGSPFLPGISPQVQPVMDFIGTSRLGALQSFIRTAAGGSLLTEFTSDIVPTDKARYVVYPSAYFVGAGTYYVGVAAVLYPGSDWTTLFMSDVALPRSVPSSSHRVFLLPPASTLGVYGTDGLGGAIPGTHTIYLRALVLDVQLGESVPFPS